jgi:rhodanese-related sulfurtransferase
MKHSPGFLAIVSDSLSRVREISVEEVRGDIESSVDFVLVDVREDSEWAASHATGAIHLAKGIIERDIETVIPEVDKKVVLYCGGGYRSALAADSLQQMGFQSVFSLAGGWRAWKDASMPIDEGSDS